MYDHRVLVQSSVRSIPYILGCARDPGLVYNLLCTEYPMRIIGIMSPIATSCTTVCRLGRVVCYVAIKELSGPPAELKLRISQTWLVVALGTGGLVVY